MTKLTRAMLAPFFGNEPRTLTAFENLARQVEDTTDAAAANVDATTALQDATVLTLSANEALANERILKLGGGLRFEDDGTYFIVSGSGFVRSQDFQATLVAPGVVTLFLPIGGTLATLEGAERLANKTLAAPLMSNLGNYASDAAAATGGVPVGGIYHNAGALHVRLA